MSSAPRHPRVRSSRHVCQDPSSKPVPAFLTFRRGVPGSQKETGAKLRASSAERCWGGWNEHLRLLVGVRRAPTAPRRCGLSGADGCAEAPAAPRGLSALSPLPPPASVVRSEHPSPRGGCRGPPRFRLVPGPISGVRPPSAPPPPPRCCPGLAACPGRSAARSLPSRRYCPVGPEHRRMRNSPAGRGAARGAGGRRAGQAGHQGHRDAEAAG